MKNKSFTKEDLELILNSLREESMSGFDNNSIKASVFNKISQYEAENRTPVMVSFQKYASIYKVAFATLAIAFFGYSGFKASSTISPISPLYPIRQNTDKIVISMLPEEKKIEKKLEITTQKIAALRSDTITQEKSYQIAESVKQDLSEIEQSIKNIKDPKKLLSVAESVTSQADSIIKQDQVQATVTTGNTLPSDIKKAIQETSAKILAHFGETQDKATNCPAYIATRIESLTQNPELNFFHPAKYSEIVTLLKDAKTKIERNDCLGALASLDIIDSYKLNIVISEAEPQTTEQPAQ